MQCCNGMGWTRREVKETKQKHRKNNKSRDSLKRRKEVDKQGGEEGSSKGNSVEKRIERLEHNRSEDYRVGNLRRAK